MKRGLSISITALLLSSVFSLGVQAEEYDDLFLDRDFLSARDDALSVLREAEEEGISDTKDSVSEALSYYGWSEFMLDNYGPALAAFQRLESAEERPFDAALGQAWVAIKLREFDKAAPLLDLAEEEAERWQRFMVLDARGWMAANMGDADAAKSFFEEEDDVLVFGQKDEDDPMVGLGWLALRAGETDAAEEAFKEGLDRKDDCFFCYDGLARIALIRENPEEALSNIVEGLKIARRNSGLQSLLFTVLVQINDPKVSVETYTTLMDAHPDDLLFQVSRGYAHLFAGDEASAESDFQAVLREDDTNASALGGLASIDLAKSALVQDGWAAYYAGRYNEAMALFDAKRHEAWEQTNPAAEVGRGWTLLAMLRPKEALETFRYAEQFDPDYTYTRSGVIAAQRQLLVSYYRGWASVNFGDFDTAMTLFEAARSEADAESMWLIEDGLAWVAYYQGNFDEAQTRFSAVLNSQPDAFLSQKGLGFVAMEKGDYESAVDHLKRSFAQAPLQSLASYTTPAQRMLEDQQFGKAAEILRLAETAYPQSADVQFMLAKAYKGLKDDQSAARRANIAALLAPAYIEPAFDELGLPNELVTDANLSFGWGRYYAGDFDGALARFDAYRDGGGQSRSASLGQGWSLLAKGQADDAIRAFQAASGDGIDGILARSGELAARQSKLVRYNEGWAALRAGDFDAADTAFTAAESEVTEALPWIADEGKAWTAYYRAEGDRGESAFQGILASYPDAYTARLGAGYAAIAQGKYEAGVAEVVASVEVAPFQGVATYTAPALMLLDADQPGNALKILEVGEASYPLSADIKALLARAHKALGDSAKATDLIVTAAGLAPAYVSPVFDDIADPSGVPNEIYMTMGWGLYFAGFNEAAMVRFDQYFDGGGEDTNAKRGRAFAQFRTGDYAGAEPALIDAANLEPDQLQMITEVLPIPGTDRFWTVVYNATSTLGWSRLRQEDPQGAEQWFRKILEIYPNLVDARTGLGYSLSEQGRKEEARAEFLYALNLSPSYPDAIQGFQALDAD